MVIAVDFDGTCVTSDFPNVGKEIGAAHVLRALDKNGHSIILNTIRSSRGDRDILKEAVDWFKSHYITLYGINEHPDQKEWTTSPKVYADLYIDDAALGIPLIEEIRFRPFVDWIHVLYMLQDKKLVTPGQVYRTIPLIIEDLKKL